MSEIEKPIMRDINGRGERGELIAGVIKAGNVAEVGTPVRAGRPTYDPNRSGRAVIYSASRVCTNRRLPRLRDLGRNRDVRRVSPGSTPTNFVESGGRVSGNARLAVIN